MNENPEASVLTAKRAAQHVRLSRANDAYEHLCILTLLPSLAPLHLMLADTPWPHGFGATLTNVGPLSEGFERSVASPLQPRRLRAMGRTVRLARHSAGNQNRAARLHTRGVCRISSASSYSPRKASIGSVLDARLAGSAEAASASSSIAMAESASTPGSNGLTSNRKERSKRDAATATNKPNTQPTDANLETAKQ